MNSDPSEPNSGHPPAQPDADGRNLFLRFRDQSDRAAFDELARRYKGELWRFLRHYVHNAALADDLLQATFLRVYEKADQYDSDRDFRPWLYSIATHAAIDALRKSRRERAFRLDQSNAAGRIESSPTQLVTDSSLTPAEIAIDDEQQEWARHAVNELPEHLRLVVLLVFYQGLKYAEAADVLGIPVGTLKSRMHAALQKLGLLARDMPSNASDDDAGLTAGAETS